MAGNESAAYLSAVRWGDEGYYLKEFIQKFTLPQAAKIIKGQYQNLGVPSLPSPSLNNVVFLASAGKKLKIAAQCVKFKDGRRVVAHGPKLAIPDTYDGWFEILSEDGRSVRCIESVAELIKRFPEICLVRENLKAYVSKPDDAESVSDKVKSVQAGETLVLVSEVVASAVRGKSGRFLRCFTSRGETIYLSVDQRGKFSPIAGEDNISGVHSVKTLITKRYPLMVRLVSGKPPVGLRNNSNFLPEMRLYSLFEEETILALPMLKDQTAVTLPPTAHLKVQAPKNADVLLKLREYAKLVEKCDKVVSEVSNRIQLFDVPTGKDLRKETKSNNPYVYHRKQKTEHSHYYNHQIRRSISDPEGTNKPPSMERRLSSPVKTRNQEGDSDDQRYCEIDQIYDYIRGFCPLPGKIRNEFPSEESTTVLMSTSDPPPADENKPEPPPIETIPIRKISADESSISGQKITVSIINKNTVEEHIYEKISRKKCEEETTTKTSSRNNSVGKMFIQKQHGNKMFTKGGGHQRTRFAKHTSDHKTRSKGSVIFKDVQKQPRPSKTYRSSKSLTTSPLFNIRYKSLTNLAADFSTLDSSHSGGQTSSGGDANKETKSRPRKLPRPKSLTNLFWEANKQVEKCNKYNLVQSDANRGTENRKLIFTHEALNAKLSNNVQNKRFGTLYL